MLQVKARAAEMLELMPRAPAELAAAIEQIESPGALADFIAGLHRHQAGGQAGRCSRRSTCSAARRACCAILLAPHRGAAAVEGDRRADAGRLERAPARGAAARAAEDDPEGARRERRRARRRSTELAEQIDEGRHAGRGREARAQGAPAPRADVRGVAASTRWCARTSTGWSSCRGRCRAEEPIDIAEARAHARRRPFGLDKVKRRILEYLAVRKLNPNGHEPDPVLRRPARRGQDLARPEHRARARPQVRARGWAACTTRRRSAATGAPTSARCRATSSRRSARRARATA